MRRDVISLLKEAKSKALAVGDTVFAKEIDEALKVPELKLETPYGTLVTEISSGASCQAAVHFETEALGTIDLCLAEIPNGELADVFKKTEGYEDGDIRILTWTDVFSEDYTRKDTIKASDIRELEKSFEQEPEREE